MSNQCEFYGSTKRKARKEHQCDACGGEIWPGDEYHDQRSLFDGRWTQSKACNPCMELFQRAWDQEKEGVNLADWVWAYHDEGEIIADAELMAFAMRNCAAILSDTYRKAKEEGNGMRRAWQSARGTAERLLRLVSSVYDVLEASARAAETANFGEKDAN